MNNQAAAKAKPVGQKWYAVYHKGEPMAAYPSRVQAICYASGASSQDDTEIVELTRSGSQGVEVSDEMIAAAQRELGFAVSDGEVRFAIEAALLAAMGGKGDGWIACSERMPEKGAKCLVWISGTYGVEHVIYLMDRPTCWQSFRDDNCMWFRGEVTHWRPLPDAPSLPPPPTTISEERAR